MNQKHRLPPLCLLIAGVVSFSQAQAISITGTVKDAGGKGIAGATVRLVLAGITTSTDTNGAYSLGSTQNLHASLASSFATAPVIHGLSLSFGVAKTQPVRIQLYDLTGRLVADLVNASLAPGEYRLPLVNANLAAKMYVVKARIGAVTTTHALTNVNKYAGMQGGLVCVHGYFQAQASAKRAAVADTLIATA
jgi:hypothetical protein